LTNKQIVFGRGKIVLVYEQLAPAQKEVFDGQQQ
jgi:hypothetical protein